MNEYELSQNKQLTSYKVKDLNSDPIFPFEDETFDKVTCVVSVDYLNQPKEVFDEIARVLRPGGECIISMSNRCFPSKAFRSECSIVCIWPYLFNTLIHPNSTSLCIS